MMQTDLIVIADTLKQLLTRQVPPLRVRVDKPGQFEVCGTKATMQGKQQVDGYYFASVIPKPKDVRLYFFPIYTHVGEYTPLSAELQKCLKGKSCFHIKKLSSDMEKELADMIQQGVALYQRDDLI